MSSIDSPTDSQIQNQQALDYEALRDGIVASAGIKRLGQMAAVKSLNRNLSAEDAIVKKNLELCEEEFFGEDVVGKHKGGDIEEPPMDIMAARDVVIHNKSPMDNSNETESKRKGNGLLGPVLGAIGATAGTGALLAALMGYPGNTSSTPEITPPNVAVDDVELEVSWEILPNGETKIDVQEVPSAN